MKPQHINATADELKGNNGLGRYVFITGSDKRAQQISGFFNNVVTFPHERQHNLYLGTLKCAQGEIDVAAISSGMGGPSVDIILNELFMIGAKRILRVGTAGSLQPDKIKVGDQIIVTGAVRDDKASWDYIYPEYPALSSFEYLLAASSAAAKLRDSITTHTGIVHSKSSLYAREFGLSFLPENQNYMKTLRKAGVIATEMECAQLFILTSLMSANQANPIILSGAILAIVGDNTPYSLDSDAIKLSIDSAIKLSIETTIQLNLIDQKRVK